MKNLLATVAALAAFVSVATVSPASNAATYNMLIHGRTGSTPSGDSYWIDGKGNDIANRVTNHVSVNYNGTSHISTSNATVVSYLNQYCTGSNTCYVIAHSAGGAQIGYAEAYHPKAWNIVNVFTGGSAAGGSELAGNTAYFFTGYAIDLDLPVSTMRSMYNHDVVGDDISGYVYNFVGGDYASLTTCLFPGGCLGGSGGNDSAVAFHSAGHFRSSGTDGSDSAPGAAGGNWWDYAFASWVDSTNGSAGHCISGSYPCEEGSEGGVMGVVTNAVAGWGQ